MRKAFVPVIALVVLGLVLSACGTPPPLVSDKYLDDSTLVSPPENCTAPCFHGITIGQTTYTDAVSKIKADSAFSDVQSQDKPPAAQWKAAGGDACCQLSANQDSGLVDAILVKLKPKVTVQQVIDKYGKPDYVTYVDYSQQEVALGLVFSKIGLVTWVTPGDANSTLKQSDPVVVVLYTDPKDFSKILDTATFQGWNGYLSYQAYKSATPIVTPRITITPSAQ